MLNVLRRIYVVAKEKLIPKPPETDKQSPKARFTEVAAKVFSVPKAEIDKREHEWQRKRKTT